jgi:hypothetical protein
MSDISEAAQARRIEELVSENTALKTENKGRRIKTRDGDAALVALRAEFVALTTAHEALKTSSTALPAEKDAKIAELTGRLTSRDHRDAFAEVASFDGPADDKGVVPKYRLGDGVKLDTIFELVKYKAEGETPTAQAIATKLGEAQRAHPYLFATVDPAADAATQPGTVARREAGPGARTTTTASTVTPSVAAQVDAAYGNRPFGRIA